MRQLFLAGIIAGCSSPLAAQAANRLYVSPPSIHVSPRAQNDEQLLYAYRQKLTPLREEILIRKAAEGGELSTASQAEFQHRLDRLNVEFERYVRKQVERGVNGWGYQQG